MVALAIMSFVRLENLNDFIQPSASCVKPSVEKKTGVVAKLNDISLSDCLACSGCITSAETVLVQQQNYDQLFNAINAAKVSNPKKLIAVSLSLQSVSSLAYRYRVGAQEAAERLASFFVSIGCDKIYDINLARHLALVESFREYLERKTENSHLPIISTSCPGWVCYAEKTNGDLIIPYLSKVRSPQQIMGALIKRHARKLGASGNDIYHVTVMPCFDKKLEASRQSFKNPGDDSADVDCVLTPIELEEILKNEDVSLLDFERRRLDVLHRLDLPFDEPLTNHIGSVSGGYAENVLLAEVNRHSEQDSVKLARKTLKNNDFIEITAHTDNTGDMVEPARFAIINGFRNIQTVVQRLKRKALRYDYIEIMACPSGCINGGAQCRPNPGDDQAKTCSNTREIYASVPPVSLSIDRQQSAVQDIYNKLDLTPDESNELLRTTFKPVPKMQTLNVSW